MQLVRQDSSSSSPALARRLRKLREERWPEMTITQAMLARALGGVAVSTVSSWESPNSNAAPPRHRLAAYATFFATRRSFAGDEPRVLGDDELDDVERAERDRLLQELTNLRQAGPAPARPSYDTGEARGTWHFPDGAPVRLICGSPPEVIQEQTKHPYADPSNPNYVGLLAYADTDALIELFGHVRAVNPESDVRFMLAKDLAADHLSGHVVLLGGLSTNQVASWFTSKVALPVRQVDDPKVKDGDIFELTQRDGTERFYPVFDPALGLVEDVGLLVRVPNPINTAKTLTICNGIFARGVVGSVRCLTDSQLRKQNEDYIATRFGGSRQFGLLMRVSVMQATTLTPDLNNKDTRIYEWPEKPA
jgi:hypothetical protein